MSEAASDSDDARIKGLPDARLRAIATALQGIPTVTGQNALDRLRGCGAKVKVDKSMVDVAVTDSLAGDVHKGDMIVDIYFDVPPVPGDPRATPYQDSVARWIVAGGKALPKTGWAKAIQNDPSLCAPRLG